MAGRIPQAFIDELVRRVDIVDVIEARIKLRKAGRDYQALCPFHDEKSPSFTVSPDKQFYHCFGCGAHGTAIGFLMAYENLEFVEAVTELAQAAGLEVPREAGASATPGVDPALYDALQRASGFFRQQLRDHPQGPVAIDYLKSRGLTGAIAAEFGIGYAPAGWDGLLNALGATPQDRAQLLAAGLLAEKAGGRLYDRFRHRIMFPIRDQRGRIIGFGGRVLGNETPKYLNSPETPLFHKGRELYGLYQARLAHPHPPRLLVVEGYMDVISLAQQGVRYAVATLGTATTPEHLTRLFRVTEELVFCFDGDRAGRDAAWRALQIALPFLREGRQIKFMFLPEGEDPDTLVRAEGAERFAERIAQSVALSRFLFETLGKQADTASMDGRARLVELARPLLSKIPPGAFRHMAEAELAGLARMDAGAVGHLINGNAPPPAPVRKSAPAPTPPNQRIGLRPLRLALALAVQQPTLGREAGDPARFRELGLPEAELFAEVLELAQSRPDVNTAAILEAWRGREQESLLAKLAAWRHPVPDEGVNAEFLGSLALLDSRRLERRREEILKALADKAPSELSAEERVQLRQLRTGPHGE